MTRFILYLALLLLVLSGCSNTRFLAEDQLLYTGRENLTIIKKHPDVKVSSVKPHIKSITAEKPNNSLFDKRILPPLGLWVYNYKKPNEKKKNGGWIYKTFAKPPILISDINPELRAQTIENDLFDRGYFQANAWSEVDTSARNPRKAKVSYFIEVTAPYLYNQIEFDSTNESLDSMVSQSDFRKKIKSERQFNIEELTSARLGLSRQIQNQGYYFFQPDFIAINADTALRNYQMNLVVQRKKALPPSVLSKYSIANIHAHLSKTSDTLGSVLDSLIFDDMTIFTSGDYLKPDVIRDAVFFTPGDLYSHSTYQHTITRLNNLGVFSYVRISYMPSGEDSLAQLLDVRIDLILADNINLDFEADLVMKSSGYLGPALSVGVSHGNAFKGAEKIHVLLTGGFEWQWGPKEENQLGSFSYDVGVGSGLTFPKILLPGDKSRIKGIMHQQTSINLDFNILNRTAYYSMFSAKLDYNYNWGKTREMKHSFSPVYLNSVSLMATTPAFDSIIDENIYIRKSFEEQLVFGFRYDFSYDNTYKNQPRSIFFQTGLSTAGNMIDLLIGMGKDESDRPYTILNNIYSQHIKLTTDFRYFFNAYNNTLAIRLYAGLGIPYLNSTVLPYVEQFFSGGAYSVRGFLARTLGPGSFHEEQSTYIDQSGDVKLEGNLEYRFGITKILKGALFVDVGNIWLVNEDENRPGAKFNLNTFPEQLAVGAGFGLRFDFTFFVLRTDFGVPIRTPYILDDRNWQVGKGNLLSEGMFYLAIGYPF